jgi:hypothetical protein
MLKPGDHDLVARLDVAAAPSLRDQIDPLSCSADEDDRSVRDEATVVIGSDPRDLLFAEQARRPDQQEGHGQNVGEPVGDAAVDKRADVDVGQVFLGSDQEASDDRARKVVSGQILGCPGCVSLGA